MSAGSFVLSKYSSNLTSRIHAIRVQPETLALEIDGTSNDAPGAVVSSPISASVTKGKEAYGLCPRKVIVKFTGTVPDGYKPDQSYSIPIMLRTTFDGINLADTGTYLGQAVQVTGKMPESAK